MSKIYYKVLNLDGSSFHGGSGKWCLPNGKPGKWMPKIDGELIPCVCGYHILKPEMLIHWLGPAIFEVEVRGKEVWRDDKGVVGQARLIKHFDTWNDQTARLFACDCAEAVIHLSKDKRSINAIKVARRFVFDLASKDELAASWAAARAAAWDASWAAARDAASDAAWDASWAAQTKRLFEYLNGQVDLEAMKQQVSRA